LQILPNITSSILLNIPKPQKHGFSVNIHQYYMPKSIVLNIHQYYLSNLQMWRRGRPEPEAAPAPGPGARGPGSAATDGGPRRRPPSTGELAPAPGPGESQADSVRLTRSRTVSESEIVNPESSWQHDDASHGGMIMIIGLGLPAAAWQPR
jgi:hypothetical protein